MYISDQKSVFLRIARASIVNILGFGFATVLIDYLTKKTDIGTPVMLLALVVVFIMLVSITSLVIFIYHTAKEIPVIMATQSADLKFTDVYGYILAALSFRIIETFIYFAYIAHIYKLFYK